MSYDIIEVLKDGLPEPYFVQNSDSDKIIYIGQKEFILPSGEYTYTIKYKVSDQIGFFDDYDEIYWNAIGTKVRFNIENTSVRIKIPSGAEVLQQSAYLGRYGESNKEYTFTRENAYLDYRSNRPLNRGEGFTIAVGFKKGYFDPPGIFKRYGTFIVVLIGILFLFPYFIYTWWRYGQDPPSPASYPIFSPPEDLSPGSLSYLLKEGYSQKSLTASIIHLAISGYLKINETEKRGLIFKSSRYELIKIKEVEDGQLPDEEQWLMTYLFSLGDVVEIDGKYQENIELAASQHAASLRSQHRPFIQKGNNIKFLGIPLLVSIVIIVLAIIFLTNNPYAEGLNYKALFLFIPILIVGFILYYFLIKKPTLEKLDIKSRIKGYRMFLEMAEKDRLNLLNPPEMTPELFESALPYAFALGVEHKWSNLFKSILEKAQYQPQWSNNIYPVHFANQFGNTFSRNLSSSATRPSSSGSGSGGGGFSGGGGGGGGVGGW